MLRIAAVGTEEDVRAQLARAFDRAPASWIVSLHESPPSDADVVVCGPGHSVDGCISFDPDQPSDVIHAIEQRFAPAARRPFFVVGANGGCGTTTVALHLAAASRGYVFEPAPRGLTDRVAISSARTWTADDPSSLELAALPVAPGLRILPAPDGTATDRVERVLVAASEMFDPVFVDCRPEELALARPRDVGVLVLSPTRPAAERARRILEARNDLRWATVTNRTGPGSTMTGRRLGSILGRNIAIELPCTSSLRDREDDGRLLTSAFSPWLRRIGRLWRALETT